LTVKKPTSIEMTKLKIKEVQLVPTDIQVAKIPIGAIPFNIYYTNGKILLCMICDETETITEDLRIDINSYNLLITFPTTAVFMNTFEFPHPNGKDFVILHAFITLKSKSLIIPTMTRNLHELVKELRA